MNAKLDMQSEIDKIRAAAFASLRQRLLGRRALYLNTASVHPDPDAVARMRERANVIDLVIGDLDAAANEVIVRDPRGGCPWGPCNAATYRTCERSGRSSFDPADADRCGAPECR